MSSHRQRGRRRRRRPPSPERSSSDTSRSTSCSSTGLRDDDVLPVMTSPASNPTSWVLLSRSGVGVPDFPGDRITTSAMSRTTRGEEVSVSFELVEPPGISVLTVGKGWGKVIAAHRDVVLLAIGDLFVYLESLRDRRSSLLLLPECSMLSTGDIGIMSCTSDDVDDSPSSFVVAELRMTAERTGNVRVFRSGSGQWEAFENLHVHVANGSRDLRCWWSTDAVVPYGRRRHMIWADYYRGLVIMDLSSVQSPRLRYVPLPVDRVRDPKDEHGWRRCPKDCRSVCVTRYGIKFVSIDTMYWTNFGVGNRHVLQWSHRFRISVWSLREDSYSWKKDLTMHEEEFWDALDGGHRFPFPHVQPQFPVVHMDNPDVVLFRLEKPEYCDADAPRWMIEVDLRKKVLLDATVYSKKSGGLSGDAQAINSARVSSCDPVPSELPRYMDGDQAY